MTVVLVADDDADIRLLVVMRLQHSGHDVTGVGDGRAAVEACRDGDHDLVVLDVMMPGMDGLAACREIRSDPVTARTPVILLTARAQSADVEAGIAAGADDYVTKPFSPRELGSRVEALLGKQGS